MGLLDLGGQKRMRRSPDKWAQYDDNILTQPQGGLLGGAAPQAPIQRPPMPSVPETAMDYDEYGLTRDLQFLPERETASGDVFASGNIQIPARVADRAVANGFLSFSPEKMEGLAWLKSILRTLWGVVSDIYEVGDQGLALWRDHNNELTAVPWEVYAQAMTKVNGEYVGLDHERQRYMYEMSRQLERDYEE